MRTARPYATVLRCSVIFNILYSVWPLLDAKCNLLGYRTHLDLLHWFIYDSTSRRYNISFTMSSDPLMSCLGAVLGSLLCSFFYLCLSLMLTANFLTNFYLCLSLPKSSLCVRNRRHLVTRFTFPVLALRWIPIIWLRRRRVFIFR
jgi:hypothetical protein